MTWREIAKIFENVELALIRSLRRNLARHKAEEKEEGFDWTAWQAEKLREINRYRRENQTIMRAYTSTVDEDTAQLLCEQYEEGIGETGPSFFGVNDQKLDSLIDDMQHTEQRAETAALRMMDDIYRRTIAQATVTMASGAATLPTAIDMATKDFLARGITCIQYKDGRRVNIADYVQMALRTNATRATLQGEAKRRDSMRIDTVLVSQYGGCSETCLPWQGRVYVDDVFGSWDGDRSSTWGQSRNGKWYPLLSVAIKNGLFHPNCRHTLTTWIEGISRMPEPLDGRKVLQNYRLEQKQRTLEREARKWMRMRDGVQSPTLRKQYEKRARDAQTDLRTFIEQHDDVLRRDYWRENTFGIQLSYRQKYDMLTSTIRGDEVHFPPRQEYQLIADDLAVDSEHIAKKHDVTDDEARKFVREAKISVTGWEGKFERYYSDSGVAYVRTTDATIRTAFKPDEFSEDVKYILEVAKELEQKGNS